MSRIEKELKVLIVEALQLEDVTPDDIEVEAPLFGDGLGLDSIDALELALAVRKAFGVEIREDTEEIERVFFSVRNLALHIQEQLEERGPNP